MASSLVAELKQLAESGSTDGKKKGKKLLWGKEYNVALKQPQRKKSEPQAPQASGSDGDNSQKATNSIHLTSWHMQDYVYKQDPCPYPTRARGLFTTEDRIVVRGYDKFFNVGEVSWTKWPQIPDYAAGPYHLTVKSNGCLILIAALSPSQLLITSKHALGPNANAAGPSHAEMGETWVDKTLRQAQRTEQDLARLLWDNSWTAVAELCDDAFEEHVLPYAPERTGLHLHGINCNERDLRTLPPDQVNDIAAEFGFIQTLYITLNTAAEVKAFGDACAADDGRWNGEHVEGFVVRSPAKGTPVDQHHNFMFKIKFDQPYLRWREWREITRRMLAFVQKQPSTSTGTLASLNEEPGMLFGVKISKMQHPETRAYATFVARQIEQDLSQFDEWKQGRGIVKTRDRFFEWLKTQPTADQSSASANESSRAADTRPFDRTMIVPIAVPGCGKTLMANALTSIFGFAHTQSDDVQAKQTKKLFLANVTKLLKTEPVVIADRNNHLQQHRRDLSDAASNKSLKDHRVRRVALVFNINKLPGNLVHRVCSDRIVRRGDRHQSLRADVDSRSHEMILEKFLHDHEPFDEVMNGDSDGRYDEMIEVDPTFEAPEMLDFITERLLEVLPGLEKPDPATTQKALTKALGYDPSIRKESKTDPVKFRYYGISVESDLLTFLESHFENVPQSLYHHLKAEGRVERRPHITLVHHKEVDSGDAEAQQTWTKAQELSKRWGADVKPVHVQLGPKIAWNERVMAIEAHLVDDPPAEELQGVLRHRSSFHITVGTRDREIPAVEGKWLIQAMHQGKDKTEDGLEVHVARVGTIVAEGRIKGMS